jgi:DNA-directed RNA polymerase subunit RPC12/RpoP
MSSASIGVKCLHCSRIIGVVHSERRVEELSLKCPHCGRRAIYRADQTFSTAPAEVQNPITR